MASVCSATHVAPATAVRGRSQSRVTQPRHAVRVAATHDRTVVLPSAKTVEGAAGVARREAMLSTAMVAAAAAASSFPALPAFAAEAQGSMYKDDLDGWSMEVPASWEVGLGGAQGAVGTRRVVAFFPKGDDLQTNVTVVITNLAADYTSLGSFGNAYEFGSRLVGSLDRRYVGKRPKWRGGNGEGDGTGQVCTLIDSKEKNGMYNVEYTLAKTGEFDRHLLQVVAIGTSGYYNRLYTVTAQAPSDSYESSKETLQAMLASFVPPPSKI